MRPRVGTLWTRGGSVVEVLFTGREITAPRLCSTDRAHTGAARWVLRSIPIFVVSEDEFRTFRRQVLGAAGTKGMLEEAAKRGFEIQRVDVASNPPSGAVAGR